MKAMIWSTGWRPSLLAMSLLVIACGRIRAESAHAKVPQDEAKEEVSSRHCAVEHFVANAADRAFAVQDYVKAESLYRAMLGESPEAATAGVVRSELGQWKLDAALRTAQVAVALQPKSALLMDVLGEVRLQRGELDESTEAFNHALQLDPCYGRVHADMARQLRLEGMFATAQRDLDVAYKLSPDDPTIARQWGSSHSTPLTTEQRIGRVQEQLKTRGIERDTEDGAGCFVEGAAVAGTGRLRDDDELRSDHAEDDSHCEERRADHRRGWRWI